MSKKVITSKNAPGAIGPYSQAVAAGGLLFVSGQIPLQPATGSMPEDVREQTAQSLENIKSIVQEAGGSMDDIVKTTIFLKDLNDFTAVNEVYSTFFAGDYPARSTVQIARLPKDAAVEIEAIAILK